MRRSAGAIPVLLVWALPLLAALISALASAADLASWQTLLAHPQLWPGLTLSLGIGVFSTAMALALALVIAAGLYRSALWQRLQAVTGLALALPHLAFAIGFGFLVMPSGWIARLIIGGDAPPQWLTVQDPWGASLMLALVLKEIPFFLLMMWSVLARGDAAVRLLAEWRAARSLGHGPGSVWLKVIQPQLLARMTWSIVIVFVYGATVVDMALVLGPTQPPTLAVIIWHDLNDADAALNARGLAGAVFITAMIAIVTAAAALLRRMIRLNHATGPSLLHTPQLAARTLGIFLVAVYAAALLILLAMSLAPRWPYPALWPEGLSVASWARLAADGSPVLLSVALAIATALTAVGLAVLWFETQAAQRDRWLIGLALVALGLPQLVTAAGLYRVLLHTPFAATLTGLFLAHLTPVAAYVIIVLAGPYRALDPRFGAVAKSLGTVGWQRWWQVTMPLLRGPLLTALAVGFGVSMVQFIPAQLIAAGRYTSLPMEAVTLASGGNRSLTAAYALALTLPPLVAFAAAARFGRPRWH